MLPNTGGHGNLGWRIQGIGRFEVKSLEKENLSGNDPELGYLLQV